MRALVTTLSLAAVAAAPPGDGKAVVGTGEGSEPANGLRGRLVVARGRTLGASAVRETLVYVELENASPTHPGVPAVYFDPGALKCDLLDAAGKSVPQTGTFGGGGRSGAVWLALPFDPALRVRANPFGFGRPDGLLIPLNDANWRRGGGRRPRCSPRSTPPTWTGTARTSFGFTPSARCCKSPGRKGRRHRRPGESPRRACGLMVPLSLPAGDERGATGAHPGPAQSARAAPKSRTAIPPPYFATNPRRSARTSR